MSTVNDNDGGFAHYILPHVTAATAAAAATRSPLKICSPPLKPKRFVVV